MGEGIKKIVYGLKKVGQCAVELENGKTIRKPGFPSADCRSCSLLDLVCEELEYPCPGIQGACERHASEVDCGECDGLVECLDSKPCCWDCRHLLDCLETAKEGWGAEFVRHRFGDWEEFVEAVKTLKT